MTDRAPPFSALRAVEAASRHRSFTWAARELNITHSAVSQSIRRLEAELGTALFARKGGAMEPSEAALRLAQSYSEAAQSLGQTIRAISGGGAATTLTVVMPADFGRLWFAGKAARLSESIPDVRVEVATSGGAERDVELAYETRARPFDEVLCDVAVYPVCAPSQAARFDEPGAILRGSLFEEGRFPWRGWAARFAPGASPPRAHVFDDAAMALEAAAQGDGLALAHDFSAESFLMAGRLQALPFAAPSGARLTLRARSGEGAKIEAIGRLAMWLKLEIRRSAALLRPR